MERQWRMSQAYLASHDGNLLVELAPVETRISLQEKGRREMMEPHECLSGMRFFFSPVVSKSGLLSIQKGSSRLEVTTLPPAHLECCTPV